MIAKEKLQETLKEIQILYDISEPEGHLMTQLLTVIVAFGYSPKLMLKLLKALTALIEMSEIDK